MIERIKTGVIGHWRAIALVLIVLAAVAVFAFPSLADSQPTELEQRFDEACKEELGPEWYMNGYADFPGVDHYDVQCGADGPGLFDDGEQTWITVSRE